MRRKRAPASAGATSPPIITAADPDQLSRQLEFVLNELDYAARLIPAGFEVLQIELDRPRFETLRTILLHCVDCRAVPITENARDLAAPFDGPPDQVDERVRARIAELTLEIVRKISRVRPAPPRVEPLPGHDLVLDVTVPELDVIYEAAWHGRRCDACRCQLPT